MTERDKVTVDDIIGIVKTEEQTDSVEEVRKLRGRGNETAKRFTIQGVGISDHERKRLYDLKTVDGFISIRDLLNEQHETIQRLQKNITELLSVDIEEELLKENEKLKQQLSEAKADEKQLGISFMGYKMKLIEVLQKKYDKVKGKTLYADVYTEIAEEMGVDLE